MLNSGEALSLKKQLLLKKGGTAFSAEKTCDGSRTPFLRGAQGESRGNHAVNCEKRTLSQKKKEGYEKKEERDASLDLPKKGPLKTQSRRERREGAETKGRFPTLWRGRKEASFPSRKEGTAEEMEAGNMTRRTSRILARMGL